MSITPVRPQDLQNLTEEKLKGINELIAKHYFPARGFFEVRQEAVAAAIGIHSSASYWDDIWKDIRRIYEPAGWNIVIKNEEVPSLNFQTNVTTTRIDVFVRFEAVIKIKK